MTIEEERELRPDLIAKLRRLALDGDQPTALIRAIQADLTPQVPSHSRVPVYAYLCESFALHLGEVIEAVARWEGFGDRSATKPSATVDEQLKGLLAPWLKEQEAAQ